MKAESLNPPIVNGATRLFGILGDPIAQVKSPEEITARFHAKGHNALCLPLHARAGAFDTVLRGVKAMGNFDGFILTIPYKVRAMPYVDKLLPRAVRVGAVNVARRDTDGTWIGDMYDGLGLVGAVRQAGLDPKGARAMVIGAGGAGSAIVDAIAEAGAVNITIFDLDQNKANEVAARLGKAHAHCRFRVSPAHAENQDLLVNATPTGMGPVDGMPAEFGKFDPSLVVADVVTKPEITPLLAHARACGCRISTGVQMFKAQADMIAGFLIPEVNHD
jgi:shikimate dehydrogenase